MTDLEQESLDFEQEPPELPIYRKAIRMFRAGTSQHEFARLDADGSIFLKIHSVNKWGDYEHDQLTVLPGDIAYDHIFNQHGLKKTGDASVVEKQLIDGHWRTLSKPPNLSLGHAPGQFRHLGQVAS